MLKLTDVTRRYDEHVVLEGLTHHFPKQGTFALMGPSGCGKTTLLRLLSGLDLPDDGRIENGFSRISCAFQEPRIVPFLTVRENLNLVLSKTADREERVTYWLQAVELLEAQNALPHALSGGMQQRLSLARALAFDGDLLLLDEPFSALDEALKARIAPFIKEANPNGLTLLVTHSKEEAALLDATVLTLTGSPAHKLM